MVPGIGFLLISCSYDFSLLSFDFLGDELDRGWNGFDRGWNGLEWVGMAFERHSFLIRFYARAVKI